MALTNCQLFERTYTALKSDIDQIIGQQMTSMMSYPMQSIPIASSAGEAITLAYPGVGANANDRCFHIAFGGSPTNTPGLANYIHILGYHIQVNFNNFTTKADFGVELRYGIDTTTGALATALNRNITVVPTQGVNAPIEFIILNIIPYLGLSSVGTVNVNANPVPVFTGTTASQDGLLLPIAHRLLATADTENAVASTIITLKGLATSTGAITSSSQCTPILCTPGSIELLKSLML
jgi:hypothetical protein